MSKPTGQLTIKPSGEPIAKLGLISHIGLAVKNCDETAKFYSRLLGIEFAVDDYDMSKGKFLNIEGKPGKARSRAAFGHIGGIGIELVEVLEGETLHTKYLRRHGEGMQHLCFYVDNIQETMAKLRAEGFLSTLEYEIELSYLGKRSRIQEVYLNTEEHLGGMTLQLMQVDPLD